MIVSSDEKTSLVTHSDYCFFDLFHVFKANGCTPMFTAIFALADNVCNFLYACLDDKPFQNGVNSWKKEFAPQEQILSSKS